MVEVRPALKTTLAQARAGGRTSASGADCLGAEGLKGKVVVGDAGYPYPEVAGKVVEKGGAYLFLLKANQGEALEWPGWGLPCKGKPSLVGSGDG